MTGHRVQRARLMAWLALWAGMACTAAAADDDEARQRERLASERAAAQASYEQTVRTCQAAFAVSGCVNQAKAERRAALDRVAREQATLDDTARRRRAEERRQRIAAKQQAAAQRAAASAPEVQARSPRPAASAASAARMARKAEPRSSEAAAAAQAEAAERSAQSLERRQRAQAHADAVRQRNAERARVKTPAAALPAPTASAASVPGRAAPASSPLN